MRAVIAADDHMVSALVPGRNCGTIRERTRESVSRISGLRVIAAVVLPVVLLLGLAPAAWGDVSPATSTTPLRQTPAPGAWDALSVEQRQAITDNVLRSRGIDAQPYRVQPGSAANYYPEKVSQAVWDAEARVSKANYGATNFSSQQLRTRIASKVLPRLMQAGGKVTTRLIPGLGTFMCRLGDRDRNQQAFHRC